MFFRKKSILLISHELSSTGAPKALFELANFLIQLEYNVVLLSFQDGPMKKSFKNIGIPVFCLNERKILKHLYLFNFFDLIICNTILCYKIINRTNKKNILWWIHEAIFFSDLLEKSSSKVRYELIKALNSCSNIYCVSEYSKSFFKHYNSNIEVLPPFVEDRYHLVEHLPVIKNNNHIKIVYVGEIIPIKGQDILLSYISSLSLDVQKKIEITFIGRIPNEEFKNNLNIINSNVKIVFTSELYSDDVLKYIWDSDVFILLSRGDSFSIAVAEAMMLNKRIIISENVGIKDIVEQAHCGYIIKDSNDFVKKFNTVINNPEKILNSSRDAFLKFFSIKAYSCKVYEILKTILK